MTNSSVQIDPATGEIMSVTETADTAPVQNSEDPGAGMTETAGPSPEEALAAAQALVAKAAADKAANDAAAAKVAEAKARADADQAKMDAEKAAAASGEGVDPGGKTEEKVPLSQQASPTGSAVGAPVGSSVGDAVDLTALFLKDSGRGLQNITAETMAIPRLNLLQFNSPEVKEGLGSHVQGAKPGMWFNTVTEQAVPTVYFIPVHFTLRHVGWYPRDQKDGSGGGLAIMDMSREKFLSLEEGGIGMRLTQDPEGKVVEVVETPEWVVLYNDPKAGLQPAAVSFPKSKFRSLAKFNAVLTMQTIANPTTGEESSIPAFANTAMLSSAVEGEGADAYFVPKIDYKGRVTDANAYRRASALQEQMARGEVEVAPAASQ